MGAMPLTKEQADALRRLLDSSETLHHRIMAKMSDPGFDLVQTWERKEAVDAEIGRFIRQAASGHPVPGSPVDPADTQQLKDRQARGNLGPEEQKGFGHGG
jgi:hypothetical protein